MLHKTLDDLSYVSFNTKIDARFAKIHREGNKVNPLFLEEFQWDNEWVDKDAEVEQRVHVDDDLTWDQVDGATTSSPFFFVAISLGEVVGFKVKGISILDVNQQ